MVEKVTGKRTGKKASAGGRKVSRGERKPARRALLPRSSASDLRAILDAAERLYRAVHVAWARADLRERGVREVKVVKVKPEPMRPRLRGVPSRLPGDPPPPAPPPWTFCTDGKGEDAPNVCAFCGEPRHLGEGEGGCDSSKRAAFEARRKLCLRLGRGADHCRFEPDHAGECEPRSTGVDPKSMPV